MTTHKQMRSIIREIPKPEKEYKWVLPIRAAKDLDLKMDKTLLDITGSRLIDFMDGIALWHGTKSSNPGKR